MKIIKPEEWVDISLKYLKDFFKEDPPKVYISWTSGPPNSSRIGFLSEIGLRELPASKEDKWQERINLFLKDVPFINDKNISVDDAVAVSNYFRENFNSVYNQLSNNKHGIYQISACVRIVEKTEEGQYIVKLFGNYYLICNSPKKVRSWDTNPKYYKYDWLFIYDSEPDSWVDRLARLTKNEVAAYLL